MMLDVRNDVWCFRSHGHVHAYQVVLPPSWTLDRSNIRCVNLFCWFCVACLCSRLQAAASKVVKGDGRNTTFTNNIRFSCPRSILSHIFCKDHRTHKFIIVVDLDSTSPQKSSVMPVHSPCKKTWW